MAGGAKKGATAKSPATAAADATEAQGTEKAAVEKQPSQNGVTRPRSGTATGRVWEIADSISASKGSPAERGEVMTAGLAENLNQATIATQYGRWRKFYGIEPVKKAAATPAAGDAATVE
jgi:hypothetical protein